MKSVGTLKVGKFDFKRFEETSEIAPPHITSDRLKIMKLISKFRLLLFQVGISQSDIKDYIGVFKKHSLKEASKIMNTKMLNRNDFVTLFKFLFENVKISELFKRREFYRMQKQEKNIILTYFAAYHPSLIYQIANNYFIDFDFSFKLYQKESLSDEIIKLTDEIQSIMKVSMNLTEQDHTEFFRYQE